MKTTENEEVGRCCPYCGGDNGFHYFWCRYRRAAKTSIAILSLLAVCGCGKLESPDNIIKQAVNATAQSYFEGGVQSALLVKAMHPEYTGTLARDEAYREWLKIYPNDPYIKAPALPQMTFDQFTNLLVQSGIASATNWFLVQGFGVPTNYTGTIVLTIEKMPRQKGILLYHHKF